MHVNFCNMSSATSPVAGEGGARRAAAGGEVTGILLRDGSLPFPQSRAGLGAAGPAARRPCFCSRPSTLPRWRRTSSRSSPWPIPHRRWARSLVMRARKTSIAGWSPGGAPAGTTTTIPAIAGIAGKFSMGSSAVSRETPAERRTGAGEGALARMQMPVDPALRRRRQRVVDGARRGVGLAADPAPRQQLPRQ
jgi:hypothetical protein